MLPWEGTVLVVAVLVFVVALVEGVVVFVVALVGAVLAFVVALVGAVLKFTSLGVLLLPIVEVPDVLLVWAKTGTRGSSAKLKEITPDPIALDKTELFMLRYFSLLNLYRVLPVAKYITVSLIKLN